jgi:hypothetical protein
MFNGIKNGWGLIKESIGVFGRHPKFLLPLLITWSIYAPIILYLQYGLNWDAYNTPQVYLIVFGVIFIFAFLLAFSCSVLLELIQHLERGEKMDVIKAFGHTVTQNTIKIFPIVIVWTVIWFILLIIQALLSEKKGEKDDTQSFTAENATRTLAGDGKFSFSAAFFNALEKGVRMVIFLILPAIAWENLGFTKAVKKGLSVFRANLTEFSTGFVLTSLVQVVLFIPPAILLYFTGELNIMLPDYIWYVTIVYIAFAWSFTIYLEQMFTAYLYMWHMKWEKEANKARRENKRIPSLREISRPSVLDEVNDLMVKVA